MDYTPVRISTVKPERALSFDLYIYFKETYLCYVKKGGLITPDKHKKLKSQKITKFYITEKDEENYQNFLDKVLEETALSSTITIADKVNLVEGAAGNALERMQKKTDATSYKATVKAVKGLNDIIFSDPEALKNIFGKTREKSDELINHSFNVCALSMKLATYRKCSAEEIENLGIAALMHDIAFSQMPEEDVLLFTKPKTELTHAEKKRYYHHTHAAGNLLSEKPFINKTILDLIMNHEEVLSGSGPNGKKKLTKLEEILSLVNNYDKRLLIGANITPMQALKEIMIDELGNYELALLNDLKAVLKHEGLIN